MEPFTKALEVVAEVMRKGAASHPDNDWVGRGPEYHLGRAEEHLRLWHDGDQLEDHMSHAATRLLMAVTFHFEKIIEVFATNRAVVITVLSIIGFPAVQGIGIGLPGMGLAAKR
jgi:hypothetical protein